MTFGSKRLDDAYDRWATQTPDEYFGEDEEMEDLAEECAEENSPIALQDYTLKKKIKLHPKQRCEKCKMLYWKKHKCQRKTK